MVICSYNEALAQILLWNNQNAGMVSAE